jgi:spore coat protein A
MFEHTHRGMVLATGPRHGAGDDKADFLAAAEHRRFRDGRRKLTMFKPWRSMQRTWPAVTALLVLCVAGTATLGVMSGAAAPPPAPLADFATPLPLPAKATPVAPNAYRITMRETTQQLHPAFGPVTKVWGYNDGTHPTSYPGPTLEVQSGTPTSVEWVNDLPDEHLLPVDTRLTDENTDEPHTLTHFHGGFIAAASDGNPAVTPGYPVGATQLASYGNAQPAAPTWYHDHAHGMTRLNVMAGLAGFYISRDGNDTGAEPNGLGVPGGQYEIPLALQDRTFTEDGQLSYPVDPPPTGPWVPEFFGDTAVVNGAVTPYADVEPRMYRFRILNGSNARFWNLQIAGSPPAWQIGTDQGLLTKPVKLSSILVAPGERADVVIDFTKLAGQSVFVRNGSLPPTIVSPAPRLSTVMQFRVGTSVTTPGPATVPASLPGAPVDLPTNGFAARRNITLEEVLDANGAPVRLELNGKRFLDPIGPNDETPREGTTEEWRFVNLSADTHPMHLHLTRFQVADRWTFNVAAYTADAKAAQAAGQPNPSPLNAKYSPKLVKKGVAPEERGWKDTVRANPGQVTVIRVNFDLPPGVEAPQRYVFHCHILEHEDNDMMRPYDVLP